MFFSLMAAIVAGAAFFLSKKVLKAPLPKHSWRMFNHPAARSLTEDQGLHFEGVYKVMRGYHVVGETAAVKWTWIREDGVQKFHVSIFFEKDAACMICEVKELRNRVLLNGYWFKQDTAESGPVRLIIHPLNGGYRIVHRKPLRKKTIRIKGWIGNDRGGARRRFVLKYIRPLFNGNSFHILGHRGAGRNADYYPYSENSLPMIRLGALLGATGIEIDVALSRDMVPVVFHDPVLSYRSLDDYYIVEPIGNKTVEELKQLTLKKGDKIPTLEEAMQTILEETPLELVWWDIKYAGDFQPLLNIYHQFQQRAKAAGRTLEIYFGISDENILRSFQQLPDYHTIACLSEMDLQTFREMMAAIWAPKWTERCTRESICEVQNGGKKVFVWTVDLSDQLSLYLSEKKYDGILTNVPSLLAFYYYSQPADNHRR